MHLIHVSKHQRVRSARDIHAHTHARHPRLFSVYADGEPAGHGDQQGDEREPLQEDGGVCQSEMNSSV